MFDHTRYQMFCATCSKVYEGDTVGEVLQKVLEHEGKMKVEVGMGRVHPRTHRDLTPPEPIEIPIQKGTI